MRRAALPVTVAATLLVLTIVPAHADDSSFMAYLRDHGYTAQYAGGEPIPAASTRALGHMICENLHVGLTIEQQRPNYPAWPQFPLLAEAAHHELCPNTPG